MLGLEGKGLSRLCRSVPRLAGHNNSFAYGVGLSQGALQNSLNDEVYDAKVDFSSQNDWSSRTNDSAEWGSVCDELLDRVEIIDCGLVYGRQGLRLSGFSMRDSHSLNP